MFLNKYIALPLILVALLSGCATNSDLRMVRAEIDAKLSAVEEKVSAQQTESTALRKEIDKINESIASLRKAEAEHENRVEKN